MYVHGLQDSTISALNSSFEISKFYASSSLPYCTGVKLVTWMSHEHYSKLLNALYLYTPPTIFCNLAINCLLCLG